MWALHHDEKYFKDPWEFLPERFLDQNGDILPVDHFKRRWYEYFSVIILMYRNTRRTILLAQ